MSQPIVIAHHLIWTAYGWWLPNDPRGSGSHAIRSDIFKELGDLHHGRKTVQPRVATVQAFQERAEDLLKHPRPTFDDAAVQQIANAFIDVIAAQKYTCYACAIMPDHVHILIRKHKHFAEEMIENLQEHSRQCLIDAKFRAPTHPVWSKGSGWKVFLDHPDDIRRTICYVQKNPNEIGQSRQDWPFVIPYDGWPLLRGTVQTRRTPKRSGLRGAILELPLAA